MNNEMREQNNTLAEIKRLMEKLVLIEAYNSNLITKKEAYKRTGIKSSLQQEEEEISYWSWDTYNLHEVKEAIKNANKERLQR